MRRYSLPFARIRLDGSRGRLIWSINNEEIFSVRSFYNHLTRRREVMDKHFPSKQIWKVLHHSELLFLVGRQLDDAF